MTTKNDTIRDKQPSWHQRLVRLIVRPPGEWPWRVASVLIPPAMLIPWPWSALYIACVFGYAILTARANSKDDYAAFVNRLNSLSRRKCPVCGLQVDEYGDCYHGKASA